MNQINDIPSFVSAIRPNGGCLHVCAIHEGRVDGRVFPVPGYMEELVEYVTANNNAGANIYFTLNGVKDRGKPYDLSKPQKGIITHIHGFHADIDPKGKGTYQERRGRLLNGRCEQVKATGPSVLVDSGNGLQALYILDEPQQATAELIGRVEAQNYGLVEALDADPGTYNADRLLRMPFTVNYSSEKKLADGYPAQTQAGVLAVGDFCDLSKLPPKVAPPTVTAPKETSGPIEPLTESQKADALARWHEQLARGKSLAKRWEGDREGLQDTSRSGLDFSTVAILKRSDFTFSEIAYLVKENPPKGSAFAERDERYLRRCYERTDGPAADQKATGEHPLLKFRDYPDKPRANTFIIPGALTDKVSIFAAYAGKGKTSAWVSVCAVVTGAMKVEGLEPKAPRHVVYASEHPEQVELMLKALVQRGVADESVLRERFHVVATQRMEPAELVKAAPGFKRLAESVTRNEITVEWDPYVVLDTASATIELEDENQGSPWASAIAKLKQEFEGIPVTIISHTSKEHRRGDDLGAMTVIGSSRQDSDVNQLLFLTSGKNDPDERFIEIAGPKHRFTADLDAIQLEAHITEMVVLDEWDEETTESVLTVDLIPVTKDQRAQGLADAKRAKAAAEKLVLKMRICTWVSDNQKARDAGEEVDLPYPSQRKLGEKLAEELNLPKNKLQEVISELKQAGSFEQRPLPEGIKLPGGVKEYIELIPSKVHRDQDEKT